MYRQMIALVLLLGACSLSATDPKDSAEKAVRPELKPSPEVAKILDNLKPGECAQLPIAKVTGDFNDIARKYGLDKNGPGIRNYCYKMVWAEDRKRALYCGGNHGVPHGLNDIWEYDLPSNTWVLLWSPEDFSRTSKGQWDQAIIKDGILQSKRGATVQAAHSWDQLTYDPEIGALIWLTTWNIAGYLPKELEQQLKKENKHPVPLWGYYPATNSWKPLGVGQKPKEAANASLLCYVPELKGVVYYGKWDYKTYFWDHETDKWRLLSERAKDGQAPTSEMLSCYNPKHKVIVAHSVHAKDGGGTHHFDPAKKLWSRTVAWESGKVPVAQDYNAVIGYDPTSGDCLLFSNAKDSFGFWRYRPDVKAWQIESPKGDMPPEGARPGYNGYFDPAHGVFVIFENAGKKVWAYRPDVASK